MCSLRRGICSLLAEMPQWNHHDDGTHAGWLAQLVRPSVGGLRGPPSTTTTATAHARIGGQT